MAVLLSAVGVSEAATPKDAPRETPSGLPVPRYGMTRFATVNARGGPGDDYKLLWTYRARGVPLQIVAETFDWRRVCDPDGGLAWVHRRTVEGERRVMNTASSPLPVRKGPKATAGLAAELAPRATATLVGCKDGWCRIKAEKLTGFVEARAVWGSDEARQCVTGGGVTGGGVTGGGARRP